MLILGTEVVMTLYLIIFRMNVKCHGEILVMSPGFLHNPPPPLLSLSESMSKSTEGEGQKERES